MLDLAARLGAMGAGRVEPNPMVGCVIAREAVESDGPAGEPRIIGLGHHRVFGGPHAEVEALADCRARGQSPRGATAYVTLEPCAHTGKTPPCCDALIEAGVGRVVIARRDPNPLAAGGAARLESAGIRVEFTAVSRSATRLSDPFVKRIRTGLPWVIAKWAQTIDGRIATRTGESQWISGERSRVLVHRLRGRVDAIMTGIGTVLADDPELTARHGVPRRRALRVVIDPQNRLPRTAKVLRTASQELPVLHVRGAGRDEQAGESPGAAPGVSVLRLPLRNELMDLERVLSHLATAHRAGSVLVESGPGLMGGMFRQDLIDEMHVYVGPMIFGDDQALPPVRGIEVEQLVEARRYRLIDARRVGDDVRSVYRRAMPD